MLYKAKKKYQSINQSISNTSTLLYHTIAILPSPVLLKAWRCSRSPWSRGRRATTWVCCCAASREMTSCVARSSASPTPSRRPSSLRYNVIHWHTCVTVWSLMGYRQMFLLDASDVYPSICLCLSASIYTIIISTYLSISFCINLCLCMSV
jgi:hypothetical protein